MPSLMNNKIRMPMSIETKRKISIALLGNKNGVGHTVSASARSRISAAKVGKNFNGVCSEETKQKIRLVHLGRKCSEATKQKMRMYALGRINSIETRKKMSDSKLGIPLSANHRRKIGESNVGKLRTLEAKKKMSIAQKAISQLPAVKLKRRIAQSKRAMPFKDTKIEVAVQNELLSRHIAFEKHKCVISPTELRGGHQCDIFIEPNIVVECDGDYWHTLDYKKERDVVVNNQLLDAGYIVLRYWEHEIIGNVAAVVDEISEAVTLLRMNGDAQ